MKNPIADALIEALDDEYKARATYRYVINTFGPVRPFIHIVEAESRHIQALIPLFHRYGVPVPPDTWEQRIAHPGSIMEACKAGVEAEIENVAMYDRLLKVTAGYPDIQRVLMNLQRASSANHLPALQRCVARTSRGCDRGAAGSAGRRKQGGHGGRRHRGGWCG